MLLINLFDEDKYKNITFINISTLKICTDITIKKKPFVTTYKGKVKPDQMLQNYKLHIYIFRLGAKILGKLKLFVGWMWVVAQGQEKNNWIDSWHLLF